MQFKDIIYDVLIVGFDVLTIGAIVKLIIQQPKSRKIRKSGYELPIANTAQLKHKSIKINDEQYRDEKYKAVYLIQYRDYDTDVASRSNSIDGVNIIYPVFPLNSCRYVMVDSSSVTLETNRFYVIEDNYTKAILIIEPDNEYFFLNVVHPKISDSSKLFYRFDNLIHKNKVTGAPQITREDLKYYKILGEYVAPISSVNFIEV